MIDVDMDVRKFSYKLRSVVVFNIQFSVSLRPQLLYVELC